MFNPKVEKSFGKRNVEEGCLSVPGFTGIIERSVTIDASYLDQNKSKIKLTASELLSQAIEHEIDHLNGIVYLDHLKSHEDLHKSGITPNDIHWHDIGYKIFINKAKASSQDKIIDEVIDKKIELSKIKSDSSIDEAILLGDRVVVISYRPGKVKEIVDINFPRPRMSNSEVKTSREYAQIRDHIWKLVKDEASQTNRGE